MKRALLAGALASLLAATAVRADDRAIGEARAAYDRGVELHRKGDHRGAATAFARADELFPSDPALEAALDASVDADDPVLGMTLVARADTRFMDGRAFRARDRAHERFSSRVARVTIACAEAPCATSIDGRAVDPRAALFVTGGSHVIVARSGAREVRRPLDVGAASLGGVLAIDVRFPAITPPAPPAPPREGPGPWRIAALATGGVAVLTAGGVVVSGLDASVKHDRFLEAGCATGPGGVAPPSDCGDRAGAGRSAQVRTNVLLGAAIGLALAAVGIELVLVPTRAVRVTGAATPQGAGVALAVTTP